MDERNRIREALRRWSLESAKTPNDPPIDVSPVPLTLPVPVKLQLTVTLENCRKELLAAICDATGDIVERAYALKQCEKWFHNQDSVTLLINVSAGTCIVAPVPEPPTTEDTFKPIV